VSANAVSFLIHGSSKVGKSTLAVTAHYPRLYLDVESASRFLPINQIEWRPFETPPPVPDGTWDTAVVYVRDYATVLKVYEWLQIGQHQFKSIIIDSISELQVRLIEKVSGREQMQQQQWGEALRALSGLLRDIRDLTMLPDNTFESIVLTSMTHHKDGKWQPYLQGAVAATAPYLFDVVGYLYVDQEHSENPEVAPKPVRVLLTEKHPDYETGERVGGRIDGWERRPNIEEMVRKVFPQVVVEQAVSELPPVV
jgi:hypothetical protein